MAKIRLTKNELKKQKDELKRFKRYLPTLQLKKQQLQMVIRRIERELKQLRAEEKQFRDDLEHWISVFGEQRTFSSDMRLEQLVRITEVEREEGNIAGVAIPVFKSVRFEETAYDLHVFPLWVDRAVEMLKELAELNARIETVRRQVDLLQQELRTTSQRVNLFEKVKIPEAQKHIRMIQIYLGDQQTAEVVRGKISKKKIVRAS